MVVYSFVLNREISEETILPGYFFYGKEVFLAYQFINELKKVLAFPDNQAYGIEKFDLENHSWMQVIDAARTGHLLFSTKSMIVVEVSEPRDKHLSSMEESVLRKYFSSPSYQTVLIIIFSGKLKQDALLFRIFSTFSSSTVFRKELRPLKEKALLIWIERKLKMTGKFATVEAKKRMVESIGSDLGRMNNEIEKIVTFIDKKKLIELDDVNQISGWIKSFDEWEILDNLFEADYEKCLLTLDNLLKKKAVPPGAILAGIVRFFRDILQAKLWLKEKAKDRRMIFKELRPKIKEKFRDLYARKYREFFSLVDTISMKDLNHFLLALREIDLKYKTSSISTKSNSRQTLLESFLFDYCCRRKNLKNLSQRSAQY